MFLIDRIAHTNRWTRKPTGEKLLLALGGLVVCLAGPPLTTGPAMLAVATAAALFAARLSAAAWFGVLLLPVSFLLAGTPMLLVSVDVSHGLSLGWRPDQLPVAAALVARSAGAAACLTLLILTTPVHAMIPPLRRIGIPAFLVEIMLLTYRLIFVFAETATRGYHAQDARLGYAGFRRGLNSLGMLAAGLFQRALERARHMEIGLAARGFDGELPVLPEDAAAASPLRCAAIAATLAAVLAFGFAAEHYFNV